MKKIYTHIVLFCAIHLSDNSTYYALSLYYGQKDDNNITFLIIVCNRIVFHYPQNKKKQVTIRTCPVYK